MNGISKDHFWLISSPAMTGSAKQHPPKSTDETIMERDRFLSVRNSPRYAKTMLVAPEMKSPLSSLNSIICHKFDARDENAVAIKAVSKAMTSIFLRPNASDRNPHECDVRIMPASFDKKICG